MTESLLSIQNLSIAFAKDNYYQRAVDKVSFDIPKGNCVALVGESGSGKSLTGLATLQLLPLAARVVAGSQILFDGVDLLTQTEHAMRRYRGVQIGMIFQDAMAAFNPVMTIGAQLREILRHAHHHPKDEYERALHCLHRVGLADPVRCYRAYPHQLSGGMRQRAMIAMALAGEPKLIIADEPTTALDVTLQAQILDLLNDLRASEQLSLLFITHDLSVAARLADHIVVMQSGHVVEKNTAKNFFMAPVDPYAKKLLRLVKEAPDFLVSEKKTEPLVCVKDLRVYYHVSRRFFWRKPTVIKAVDGVSFTLQQGKTHALVGESGSGKSTIARSMIRLLKPSSGMISFQNQDAWHVSGARLQKLRKDMQIIFQDPYASLSPRRMVAESISEGLWVNKLVKTKAAMLQRVDSLLAQVGLPLESKWRYPHEFSGGERQRLCIARALAVEPQLLILDEPTSALDVSMQSQILDLLRDLQQRYGITYLLITHDLSVVRRMAHDVSVLRHGQVVESGPTALLLTHPQTAYTRQLVSLIPSRIFNPKDEALER